MVVALLVLILLVLALSTNAFWNVLAILLFGGLFLALVELICAVGVVFFNIYKREKIAEMHREAARIAPPRHEQGPQARWASESEWKPPGVGLHLCRDKAGLATASAGAGPMVSLRATSPCAAQFLSQLLLQMTASFSLRSPNPPASPCRTKPTAEIFSMQGWSSV